MSTEDFDRWSVVLWVESDAAVACILTLRGDAISKGGGMSILELHGVLLQ